MEKTSIGRAIGYFGLLSILCLVTFLVAKYIVRNNIEGEEMPIDTSERI